MKTGFTNPTLPPALLKSSVVGLLLFAVSFSAIATPRDSWSSSRDDSPYAVCISKGNSANTCSVYADRGNDGGRGYIACLNAGNSPMTCTTYPSHGSGGDSRRGQWSDSGSRSRRGDSPYAVCISKGNSANTCSTYPDRGDDRGRGYIACLEAGNSPMTCSAYPSQRELPLPPVKPEPVVVAPIAPAKVPTPPSSTVDDEINSSDDEAVSSSLSTDQGFFQVEWFTGSKFTCEALRKSHPDKSFLIVSVVYRSASGTISFQNPAFCLSKSREQEVQKQLKVRTARLAPSGNGMMSLDSFTASRICRLFKMPNLINVEGYSVRANFALYRFARNGSVIAENAGIDETDANAGVLRNITKVDCAGRTLSDTDLRNIKPILLK